MSRYIIKGICAGLGILLFGILQARAVSPQEWSAEELFRAPVEEGGGDGYFGLRLLKSHVLIAGFEVRSL